MILSRSGAGVICRCLMTSVSHRSKVFKVVSANQQAKLMKKALEMSRKKERQLLTPLQTETDPEPEPRPAQARVRALRPTSSKHRHRLETLSTIYLSRVAEVLSMGELLPGLSGSGLSLTRVQLSGNMRQVYVFWAVPAGTDAAQQRHLAAQLERAAAPLRTMLTQQRVTGHVPAIKFVRDSQETLFWVSADSQKETLVEVERRLAELDYGPDFSPADPTHFIKRQALLGRPISEQHTESLLGLEEPEPDSGPQLPYNSAGLNRAAILEEVQQRVRRAAAPHRQGEVAEFPEAVTPQSPPRTAADAEHNFERFAQRRKWERFKKRGGKTVSLAEWESLRNRGQEEGEFDVADPDDAAEYYEDDSSRSSPAAPP